MADKSPATPSASAEEVQELRKAQDTEYGTYVAVATITYNGAIAYQPGSPVPVSNVQHYGYDKQGLVARIDSAEGKRTITAIHEANLVAATNTEQAPEVSLAVPVPDTKSK